MLRTSGNTVWVAVSQFASGNEGFEPLMGVGDSAEAAQQALDLIVAEYSKGVEGFDRDLWVDEHPLELPIYTLNRRT